MWIKCQNKQRLVEAKDTIEIVHQWQWCIFVRHLNVGEYSSEEKALKVFYDIQKEILKIMANGTTFGFEPPKIFIMPQDDEVEVKDDNYGIRGSIFVVDEF